MCATSKISLCLLSAVLQMCHIPFQLVVQKFKMKFHENVIMLSILKKQIKCHEKAKLLP